MWIEGKMHQQVESCKYVKKSQTKGKIKNVKILTIGITVLVIIGGLGCVAYNAGFLPIKGILNTIKPVGASAELDIDNYMAEYLKLEDIPNLDKIKYAAYGTDESITVVADDYKEKLEKKGYNVKYEGTGCTEGRNLKGLTAVGIIMTPDTSEEFGYETTLLYTTGNAFEYKEILDWYEENQ